jgi:hypothetical protein
MSRQQVIRRIVEREQQRFNLTEKVIQQEEPELYSMACTCFGAWDTALLYAGVNLKVMRKRFLYSRQQVLVHIKRFCWRGYRLTATNVQRYHYRLFKAAVKYFGSWEKALQAAGVNLPLSGLKTGKPRRLPKEKVLAEIHQWQAEGHSLRWHDVCLQNRELAVAAKTAFLSWRKALVAAGLRSAALTPTPRRKWTRELVLAIIRERQQAGKSLERKNLRKEDPSLLHHASKYFESWKAAILAAAITFAAERGPQGKESSADAVAKRTP